MRLISYIVLRVAGRTNLRRVLPWRRIRDNALVVVTTTQPMLFMRLLLNRSFTKRTKYMFQRRDSRICVPLK